MMGSSKKSIKRVTVIIMLMFAVMISYLLKTVIKDSSKMIVNSYNPRISSADTTIKRGDIRDINGYVLAESVKGGKGYERKYNNAKTSCHVVGYTGAGKAGTEAVENFTLQHIDSELFQRMKCFIKGDSVEGDSVYLTIDKNLQDVASKLMGTNKGAVVIEEVSTGRILCMLSKPMYDPETLAQDWDELKVDETTPLVNRAAQGEYTPGSIFKIVTATAAIRNIPDIDTFTYTCKGEADFGDKTIHCFNKKVHGEENITSGFANSCNCFFSELGEKVGAGNLRKTSDDLLFNTGVGFSLPYSIPSVKIDKKASESELVETSIGQGRTTVTPLFMASIVQAIANNGVMMQPYIKDHVVNFADVTVDTTIPKTLRTVFTKNECEQLKEMMISVVNEGTGFNAKSEYFQVAGKTGTAENPGGNDHLWFVGFAPADNPKYAVSVVLENADGSANASVIARKMLYNAINKEQIK